jgi:hypothetical protein
MGISDKLVMSKLFDNRALLTVGTYALALLILRRVIAEESRGEKNCGETLCLDTKHSPHINLPIYLLIKTLSKNNIMMTRPTTENTLYK